MLSKLLTQRIARVCVATTLVAGIGLANVAAQAAPATAGSLALAPEQSHIALALPDLQALVDQIKAIDSRMNPDGDGISGDIDSLVRQLANEAGAFGATDLNAVAEARGLDATQGIGLFVDLTPSIDSLLKQLADHKAAQADAEEGAEESFELEIDDADPPLIAGVLTVKDEEKVKEAIEELISSSSELAYLEEEESEIGDVKVTTVGDYAYFIHGGKVVLGSSAMVKGAATRVAAPAAVRYGSSDAPVQTPNEAVALIYGQKFLPALKEALPYLDLGGDAKPFIDTQLASIDVMMADGDPNDPLILSLGVSDEKVQLDLRMDTAKHPGVLAISGEASPLRLAQVLPEETLAFVSLRFNEQSKKQLVETYVPAIADATGQSGDPQRLLIVNQVLDMIGDEVTLGVAGSRDDFPSLFLMIGLRDPEPTKGLLSMFIPTMPGETHNEVEIKSVAAPVPVPISIAFPGDMLLLSNSVDGMKGVIDLVTAKETSKLFANIKLDPATPRYNGIVLDSRLFSDVVLPLSSLMGGLPAGADSVVGGLTPVVQELRFLNEIQGSWSVTQLAVALHPPVEVEEEAAE